MPSNYSRQSHFIVNQEELQEITGYSRPAEIAACLQRQGVRYLTGKRGQIWTTVGAIEFALGTSELFIPDQNEQNIEI